VLSLIPSSLLKFSQWTSSTDLGEGLDLTLERGGSLFGQESQRSGSWFFELPVRHGGVVEVVEVFDVQAKALIRRRRRRAQAAAASTRASSEQRINLIPLHPGLSIGFKKKRRGSERGSAESNR
jgi:hypothetical protein